jgi:hypothetical protein
MTVRQTFDKRTSSRKRVLMTAKVVSAVASHGVRLRDISRTGVQISTDTRIPEGQDVCFSKGPIFVAAHVAWSRHDAAGLRFYRELTTAEHETAFHPVVLIEGDER